jgi:uncharacterized protein YqfB (UPF0267 family)
MKQRPIIFNTAMVQAILDGRKTQTRRPIKGVPRLDSCGNFIVGDSNYGQDVYGKPQTKAFIEFHCPFGKIGDQLWVRETFQGPLFDSEQMCEYKEDNGKFEKPEYCVYRASDKCPEFFDMDDNLVCRWRPSIHMPRWAARILLEVTAIRVERLNDISEKNAAKEGFELPEAPSMDWKFNAKHNFKFTWDKIYNNWSSNPFVWVIEFKVTSTTGSKA